MRGWIFRRIDNIEAIDIRKCRIEFQKFRPQSNK